MENRSLIERLARHLSAASPDEWPVRVEDAASIMALMKEPDAAMRAAGDGDVWAAMIDAALRERWSLPTPAAGADIADGSDEEGEIQLTGDAIGHDRADWVHIHPAQGKDR